MPIKTEFLIVIIVFIAFLIYWAWITRTKKVKDLFQIEKPCHCEHITWCDINDRCMKNERN